MSNAELFITIVHSLRDYDDALLLALLVAQGATESPVKATRRTLAENYLGQALDRNRVHRASDRLVKRGLLQMRVYPKTYTEYSVPVDALRALLAQPFPDARHFPGVSQLPIPFLARLQAESVLDTVSAGASASLPPASEDVK